MIKIHIFCITSEGFFFNLLPSQRFLPTPLHSAACVVFWESLGKLNSKAVVFFG